MSKSESVTAAVKNNVVVEYDEDSATFCIAKTFGVLQSISDLSIEDLTDLSVLILEIAQKAAAIKQQRLFYRKMLSDHVFGD